jgi:hypothetical protein
MTKWRAALLFTTLLIGCTQLQHQAATPPSPAASTTPQTGEQLLAQPPAGWVQSFQTAAPGTRMVEYVPPGTDPADWTDKVSFESFSGDPLPDPVELATSVANDRRASCDGFASYATYSGSENGYPTAVRLFVCNHVKQTQKGQLTLLKMIRGDSNFYVIMRTRRVEALDNDAALPMPREVMAEWSLYLRAIGVCNSDAAAHPCPSAAAPAVEAEPAASE